MVRMSKREMGRICEIWNELRSNEWVASSRQPHTTLEPARMTNVVARKIQSAAIYHRDNYIISVLLAARTEREECSISRSTLFNFPLRARL